MLTVILSQMLCSIHVQQNIPAASLHRIEHRVVQQFYKNECKYNMQLLHVYIHTWCHMHKCKPHFAYHDWVISRVCLGQRMLLFLKHGQLLDMAHKITCTQDIDQAGTAIKKVCCKNCIYMYMQQRHYKHVHTCLYTVVLRWQRHQCFQQDCKAVTGIMFSQYIISGEPIHVSAMMYFNTCTCIYDCTYFAIGGTWK